MLDSGYQQSISTAVFIHHQEGSKKSSRQEEHADHNPSVVTCACSTPWGPFNAERVTHSTPAGPFNAGGQRGSCNDHPTQQKNGGPSDDPAATTGTSGRAHGRTRRAGTRALKGRPQVARKREGGAHESLESVKFLLRRQARLFIQTRVYGECRIGRPSKHGDKR